METEDQYWVICFKQPSRHYVFSWSQKKKTSRVLGVGFPYGALGEDWRKSFQELVERHGKRLTLHFGEALEEVPRRHTWAMKSQGPWLFRVYRGLYTCCLAKKPAAFSKKPSLKLPYILKIDPFEKGIFLLETMIFNGDLFVLRWPLGFPHRRSNLKGGLGLPPLPHGNDVLAVLWRPAGCWWGELGGAESYGNDQWSGRFAWKLQGDLGERMMMMMMMMMVILEVLDNFDFFQIFFVESW